MGDCSSLFQWPPRWHQNTSIVRIIQTIVVFYHNPTGGAGLLTLRLHVTVILRTDLAIIRTCIVFINSSPTAVRDPFNDQNLSWNVQTIAVLCYRSLNTSFCVFKSLTFFFPVSSSDTAGATGPKTPPRGADVAPSSEIKSTPTAGVRLQSVKTLVL